MDLNKSREFFDPNKLRQPIHIVGCGAVGSSLAELLARQGCTNLHLWDGDIVQSHNIVNQMFLHTQVNMKKTDALAGLLVAINPHIREHITLHDWWTPGSRLTGYIFLCVDDIGTRREIVDDNLYNPHILAMFDFRMTLLQGQHYGALWEDHKAKTNFRESMNFTHDESTKNTPVSACGFELSIAPTIRSITALGIANFINLVNTGHMKNVITTDPFAYGMLAL